MSIIACNNEKPKPTTPGEKTAAENPLLKPFNTPFNVPPVDRLEPGHFLPALKAGIKTQQKQIEAIASNPQPPTFENTITALDESGDPVFQVDRTFVPLRAVNGTPEMQKVAKDFLALMAANKDNIWQNGALFKRVDAVFKKKDELKLSEEQLMVLDKFYRKFVHGGANLEDPKQKARLKEINKRLEVLKVNFGENLINQDNRFKLVVEKEEDLAGLTKGVIQAASETAEKKGLKGKWVFTLHKPSLIPFLQYSAKRELREKIFTAYINRGNTGDELDNKKNLLEILSLRSERAKMLGYDNHALIRLEPNMAKNPEAVEKLLMQLWKPALAQAKNEVKELQEMIDKEGGKFKLEPWDWWYYAEKLKKEKYDVDDNLLRPYFKLENVRDGAFYVANKLWGLTFTERKDIPKYHEEVQVFEVKEADGSHLGILYLDYFPRDTKQGGAWMNAFRKQARRKGKNITPVITNNGNFTRPTSDTPSLLSFDEVETLFHEFGHALHGLLSDCTYDRISGTSVARDFVELPSQIMENWVDEPEMLKAYAKHYQTGEVIPNHLVEKIKKASLFNIGFKRVEYLSACFLDLAWYTAENPGEQDIFAFEKQALDKIGMIPEIVVRYRSPYFRHIFTGDYSMGYYSYIWAEVLDADAYAAFKEAGIFDVETAKKFREHILSKGGSADPMELYKKFRGAAPRIEPLLKRSGAL